MLTADAFPAPVQEKQKIPEAPNFLSHVENLEHMALEGIETPNGRESLQFRAGIEVEFMLINPAQFRDHIADTDQRALEIVNREVANTDSTIMKQMFWEAYEQRLKDRHQRELSLLQNPELVGGELADTTELLAEFRSHAAERIKQLPAQNEAEEQKRQQWLEQIPDFGLREFINFQLYEEFSKMTLADNPTPSNSTMEELDNYSDRQGWLEFRFGTGSFQSGYYDNENMCELRTAPCQPSEAVRRKQIIVKRLVELASQFGLLVQTNHEFEHLNISLYQADATAGQFRPIIGQKPERHEKTLDITAGIAAAYSDGLWLQPYDMQFDFHFRKNNQLDKLRFGPTRNKVRIMDDRLELRSGFREEAHGLNWLMAGALSGLQQGYSAIEEAGYRVPGESTVLHIQRNPEFNKEADLHIQRAFENCTFVDGIFSLENSYNWQRWEEITKSLLGVSEVFEGSEEFNSVVFACATLDQSGEPSVDAERLQQLYDQLDPKSKEVVQNYVKSDFTAMAQRLNKRLKAVRLTPTSVIKGEGNYEVDGSEAAMARLQASPIAQLAFENETQKVVSWLKAALPGPEES